MATRRKLKKQVYYVIGIVILIIALGIFGIVKYKEYKYQQTNEYKLLEHGYNDSEVARILEEFSDQEYIDYLLNSFVYIIIMWINVIFLIHIITFLFNLKKKTLNITISTYAIPDSYNRYTYI